MCPSAVLTDHSWGDLLPAPSAADVFRQAEWEMVGIRRAQEAFMENLRVSSEAGRFHETGPGRKLLRRLATALIPVVEDSLADAGKKVVGRGAAGVAEAALLAFADSPKEAAVVACAALVGEIVKSDLPKVLATALRVAGSLQVQLAFENFQTSSKECKKAGDDRPAAILKRFKDAFPNPNQRQWREWAKRADLIGKAEWDKATRIHVGTWFIKRVCEVSEGDIEIVDAPLDGNIHELRLRASERLLADLAQDADRLSVTAPKLTAMTMPPVAWRYSDSATI